MSTIMDRVRQNKHFGVFFKEPMADAERTRKDKLLERAGAIQSCLKSESWISGVLPIINELKSEFEHLYLSPTSNRDAVETARLRASGLILLLERLEKEIANIPSLSDEIKQDEELRYVRRTKNAG